MGMTFLPDPKNPGKTIIKQILECDLMGDIPQWIWALSIKDTAFSLVKFRQGMKNFIKNNKKWIYKEIVYQ